MEKQQMMNNQQIRRFVNNEVKGVLWEEEVGRPTLESWVVEGVCSGNS